MSAAAEAAAPPPEPEPEAHDERHEAYQDPQVVILDAALGHVGEHGWSKDAIAAGAAELGFPPLSHGMFERGEFDLVRHAMRRATETMAAHMETLDLASMSGDERIIAGVRARLEHLAPFMATGSWAQAMAVGALPFNALDTTAELGVLVDELWYLAGDRSTDGSWYSRRSLLLGVHASTELYMLTDRSEGYEDTWEFLERRVKDVSSLGSSAGAAGDMAAALGTGLTSLAGGAFSLARPFVEAQKGNTNEAMSAAMGTLNRVRDAAAAAVENRGEAKPDPDRK